MNSKVLSHSVHTTTEYHHQPGRPIQLNISQPTHLPLSTLPDNLAKTPAPGLKGSDDTFSAPPPGYHPPHTLTTSQHDSRSSPRPNPGKKTAGTIGEAEKCRIAHGSLLQIPQSGAADCTGKVVCTGDAFHLSVAKRTAGGKQGSSRVVGLRTPPSRPGGGRWGGWVGLRYIGAQSKIGNRECRAQLMGRKKNKRDVNDW
jgi:hypothetical protein